MTKQKWGQTKGIKPAYGPEKMKVSKHSKISTLLSNPNNLEQFTMRSIATFLMLFAAIGGAIAAPGAKVVEIEAREVGVGIKICNDTNLGGNCVDATVYAQHDCC
jgi:hypothetical protein